MSPSKSTGSDKHQAYHEEAPLRRAYDGRLLRRVWAFVAPHRTLVLVSLSTLVLLSVAGLVRPLVMGNVAKHASDGNADLLLRDGVILALMAVAMQTMTFAQTYSMQLAGARSMADLRSAIFAHLQRMRLRYFDRTPIGRLVTRATNDVDGLNELFASGVLNALGDVIALGGIIAMMIALHWRMAIIAFMALPFVAIIVLVTRGKAREAYRAIRTRTARLNAFINEQVSGIAVVQAFAREQAMAEEFDEINAAYRDANKASVFFEAIVDAAIEMVGTLCVASVLWWAGLKNLQHGDDTVTFALVVTFTQYIKQFFEPISLLSQRYTVLQSAMSGAERIFELLDDPDVEPLPREADQADASRLDGDEALAFEDVTFEYKPGVPVLQQVSLKARRGERIALVGATGAGKTTVASLCLRLYEVTSGEIRVLGRSVAAYAPRELRQLFSVVPQDVYLFPGTVLSNVAVSDAEPDRAKAEAALARIGALEFFLRREGGLDARVEERGSNFSAGERQLLAFARAVYKHAPLVILDEATASVDSATEAQLQRALDALLAGCTSIVIAHRLSTIRSADRIVVFHKGRIVEQGSHEELLAHGGVYAKLHRLQFAREEADQEQARPHPGTPSSRSPVRVEA